MSQTEEFAQHPADKSILGVRSIAVFIQQLRAMICPMQYQQTSEAVWQIDNCYSILETPPIDSSTGGKADSALIPLYGSPPGVNCDEFLAWIIGTPTIDIESLWRTLEVPLLADSKPRADGK